MEDITKLYAALMFLQSGYEDAANDEAGWNFLHSELLIGMLTSEYAVSFGFL